jgi:hypothetical protein
VAVTPATLNHHAQRSTSLLRSPRLETLKVQRIPRDGADVPRLRATCQNSI